MNYEQVASKMAPESNHKKILELIIKSKTSDGIIKDSKKSVIHTPDEITEMQKLMLDQIQAGMIEDGGKFMTVADARKSIGNFIKDSYFNPLTQIGTLDDPSVWNQADIPISISPYDATSYYSSGGIAASIINKKSYGILQNGYLFEGTGWSEGELESLLEHAKKKNFDELFGDGMRDGLLYGGSLVVPRLKKDTALTYQYSVEKLRKLGLITKDCIDYFWTADRWNAVLIPDYNISAQSYLNPPEIYVPIAGVGVHSDRMAILRPKKLPYWGTLRQMGWGVSELESWIRSMLGYEVMIATLPIIAQQLSILYNQLPSDQVLAQSGEQALRDLANFNQAQMKTMSNANPRMVNLAGELKTIERHYTDLEDLYTIIRQDIAAKSGIPESVLFHTQPTGFSDNEGDMTMKQAEATKLISSVVIPQTQNLVKMLVWDCFGPDSPQGQRADTVRLSFESPVIVTDEEKAESGGKFFEMLANGTNSGLPLDMTMRLAKQFVPWVELSDDDIDRLANANTPPEQEIESGQPGESPAKQFMQGKQESAAKTFMEGHQKSEAANFVQKDSNSFTDFFRKFFGRK